MSYTTTKGLNVVFKTALIYYREDRGISLKSTTTGYKTKRFERKHNQNMRVNTIGGNT